MGQMPSLESTLSNDESFADKLPDGPESDSSSESSEPKAETSEKPVAAKADATPHGDDDSEGDELAPQDLSAAGVRKALESERKLRKAERKRAQELQRELDRRDGELSVRRQQSQAQPVKSDEPKPEDLETEFYANPVAFFQKQLGAKIPDVNQAITKARIDLSEVYAKRAHADYKEKAEAFKKAAASQPHLWAKLRESEDPGEYAYQTGTLILEADEVGGDLNAWKEKERAKIKAELSGEQVESTPKAPARQPIPKSNAGARGSGAGVTQAWSGPRSLQDTLARR